ncbi:MAG TPA: hypothetical protein DC017_10670 [Candidatus Wallbacteria bacterium]|jgi:hypothetical protein|nr:hypothetical protein [Candidatus Wallbacteria bacterium]
MKEKDGVTEIKMNACSYNPMFDGVICNYADIDANGAIYLSALCRDKFSSQLVCIKKRLPFDNFYVDKNYFDILVADPVRKANYYLYNVYYIEDSNIYIAGVTSRLSFENSPSRAIKSRMSTHLLIDWHFGMKENEFIYETNSLYSVKFNPNYFSQINSLENLEKISQSYKLYSQLAECTAPYDRPANYIQRAFFMKGAGSVKKYGLDYDSYKKLSSYLSASKMKEASDCYFSFEQFYLSGVLAALNFYGISK